MLLIVPLIAAGLSFFAAKNVQALGKIAIIATTIELVATIAITASLGYGAGSSFGSYLHVDHLGAILLLLLSFGGLATAIYARGYLATEVAKGVIGVNRAKKLFAQFHVFILAMAVAIIATNPLVMWIAIEATTLSTAFLISFYDKPSSIEAAWKYLILNSVGLLLAFFGTLLFLSPQPAHTGLASWQSLLANAAFYHPFIIKMAFLFTLIGYGTKVGLVPMHTWLPDAHSKAPSPISSLLSGVLLNIPLLAILRFKTITDAAIGPDFSSRLLITFGLLSLVVSSVIILVQKNYKRLLAYSSIEHMGIITLGFGIGGAGAFGALLHMVYHSLAKSLLFLSSGNIALAFDSTEIKNVRGLLQKLPITAVVFFFGVLTIIGIPPMGMFFTEFSILSAGMKTHPGVSIVALVALVLAGVGFIRHLTVMEFGHTNEGVNPKERVSWTTVPVLVLAILIVVFSLVVPQSIQTFLRQAASSL